MSQKTQGEEQRERERERERERIELKSNLDGAPHHLSTANEQNRKLMHFEHNEANLQA